MQFLGPLGERLGCILEASGGAYWKKFLGRLGASGEPLGGLLGASWGLLGPRGALLGPAGLA